MSKRKFPGLPSAPYFVFAEDGNGVTLIPNGEPYPPVEQLEKCVKLLNFVIFKGQSFIDSLNKRIDKKNKKMVETNRRRK